MDSPHHSSDTDSSAIIGASDGAKMDLGGLLSGQFSNIVRIYTSPHGPTELYAATRYGKRYILKALKEEYRNDPLHALALAKEFEIGIFIEHANIRRTIGLEEVEGLGKAIVLEYVDGRPLDKMLASEKITAANARDLARQLADAIGYLHSRQVLHRDLKPANIIVTHRGDIVKIIDFNLSDSDNYIIFKNPAGSRKYMAPEQLQPDAVPSAVADIYSLGVIMGELATAADDALLAEAAEKCCNTNPCKRPQTISGLQLPASKPSLYEKFSNFLASKTLTWIMTAACITLAAYIIFIFLNQPN